MQCKNCPPGVKKSYKGTEPSPNGLGYSAAYERLGTKCKGLDNRTWQVVSSGNKQTWVPLSQSAASQRQAKPSSAPSKSTSRAKKYNIHDNGGTPFTVAVSKDQVDIYGSEEWSSEDSEDSYDDSVPDAANNTKLLLTLRNVQTVFVGKDIKNRLPENDGNSLLVKEATGSSYVYIGSEVYRFTPSDEIKDYFSPVGNSDVPYPYAVGVARTYLLLESVSMPNEELVPGDPYLQYYDLTKKARVAKGVKAITKRVLIPSQM